MLNFDFLEKCLGTVSPAHFMYFVYFYNKYLQNLKQYTIKWGNN